MVSWWKGRPSVRGRGQSRRFGYSSKNFGGEGEEGVGLSLSSQLGQGMKAKHVCRQKRKGWIETEAWLENSLPPQ